MLTITDDDDAQLCKNFALGILSLLPQLDLFTTHTYKLPAELVSISHVVSHHGMQRSNLNQINFDFRAAH